jgi:hypothetical protein
MVVRTERPVARFFNFQLEHSPLEQATFFIHDVRTQETLTLVGVCACPDRLHCHSTAGGPLLEHLTT